MEMSIDKHELSNTHLALDIDIAISFECVLRHFMFTFVLR